MENASDALIMAGSVLLLIIALTVSISSFTSLKLQVDEIMTSRDQVQMVQDETGNYLNYLRNDNTNDVRKVQTEAIISALRRMRKEDYTIYIVGTINTGDGKKVLPNLVLSGEEKKKNVQKYTNLGKENILVDSSSTIIELSMKNQRYIFYNSTQDGMVTQELNETLLSELYEVTKDKNYSEYIGVYQDKTEEGVSEANKTTHKIITFVQN